MATLNIRPMQDNEVDPVVALWTACGLTVPHNDPYRDIAFARASNCSDILVGLLDRQIVASVMVGHDGHRGVVYYVSTSPDHRGQGLGRDIMAGAERWLEDRGIWKLNLMIRDTNTQVQTFYEKLGYGAEPRVVMAKRLDPQP